MSNIISLLDYKSKTVEKKITANTVNALVTAMIQDYTAILDEYKVDVEDPDIAFDIATIQFLMRGMAHRSQGENHPSQQILDVMRSNMLGT
jgi:uncharacterized protein YeeX (DUF496 family)